MRSIILIIASIFITNVFTFAQPDDYSRETANYGMGIGPVIGYKMGINAAEPPDGIKNGLGLAGMPDFGASFYLPLNPDDKMGLFLDLVYGNYAYLQKFSESSVDWTDQFNYFAIGANFYISGFTIGLNVGLPMANGKRVYSNSDMDIESSTLNTMFELKIGGNFTLNESELGRLLLFINAGYQINGQYTDEVQYGSFNPHPASLNLGFSYLFNLESYQ